MTVWLLSRCFIDRKSTVDQVGNQSHREHSFLVAQATERINTPLNVRDRGAVDILFVIDNSGSMDDEQEEMAKRFSSFLSLLFDLSWQVGITTTDLSDSNKYYTDGKLIPVDESNNFHLHSR